MNKAVTGILLIVAIGLIAYNITLIDFQDPLHGDSIIAVIGILASLCAIVLLLIFITSRKIEKKIKDD